MTPQRATSLSHSMRASTPSPHVGDDEHAVDMPLIAKDGQHHVLDPNAKPSCQVRWRVALLALMCFQILVGAGVVYGWPALESTMIEVGVYAEACDRDSSAVAQPSMTASIACHKQLLKLNTIYVAASWGCQASGLLGFVLDKVGVRVTVVGSSLALALGSAAFAMSSGANPWFDLFLPGLTLMGVAGSGIYLSAQGLGNLFPAATRRMALFAITGVFAPSMLVFLAFHILVVSEGLITLRSAFLLYVGDGVCVLLLGAVTHTHCGVSDAACGHQVRRVSAGACSCQPRCVAQQVRRNPD